jgi:hypothetical protein
LVSIGENIWVQTAEGKGTIFVVEIPIDTKRKNEKR